MPKEIEESIVAERRAERQVFHNLPKEELVQHALLLGQGFQIDVPLPEGGTAKGAIAVETGEHTARSAQDKFYVKNPESGDIWEKVNKPLTPEDFALLYMDVDDFLTTQNHEYILDLALGADVTSATRQLVRIRTHSPWHALFATNLYRELTPDEKSRSEQVDYKSDLEILHAPGFSASPERHHTRSGTAIATDFTNGQAVITETQYGGEMKKLGLTWEHYVADREGHAALHGSLIRKKNGGAVAIMGGSGTGKSTCAQIQIYEDGQPTIQPVGDDEILVDTDGIASNIEGGCYPSVGNIDPIKEPEFFMGSLQATSILENVKMFEGTLIPDFANLSLTPNTRAAIDLDDMPNMDKEGIGGPLEDIILLTADGRGVMPPVAKLRDYEQAMFYLLSGRTSKMPGKEKGITQLKEESSALLAEPFLVREPRVHAEAIGKIIKENNINVWLVNTGWSGGPYGVGERMDIELTQLIIKAIASDTLKDIATTVDPVFGFEIPNECPGVDSFLLTPENAWSDKNAQMSAKLALAQDYVRTFSEKFLPDLDPNMLPIAQAGPRV